METNEYGKVSSNGTVKMPPGTYYLGDPCYSIPESQWDQWLSDAGLFDSDLAEAVIAAPIDGLIAVGVQTAYGDGSYEDNTGHLHPVDSGMIGLVPVQVVGSDEPSLPVVCFGDDFECSYRNGTIVLGHIEIVTDDSDTDDDEFDEGDNDY